MTELDLKRLERNLSKSAMNAKPFYVRGMTGVLESEQGFFSINIIPVYNPIQGKETMLIQFIEDVGILKNEYDKTKQDLENLKNEFMLISDALSARIEELERIQTATDSLVLE